MQQSSASSPSCYRIFSIQVEHDPLQDNMNGKRTLCFIGAHPDDETFGVGNTLAYYAAAGVDVYYVCATRGEAGMNNLNQLRGFKSLAELRTDELNYAASVLGLAGVVHLGYRDSGMPGAEDNKHPEALAAAPVDEVSERIVKIIRDLKPDVVITHDPIGGYRHPDHVAIHILLLLDQSRETELFQIIISGLDTKAFHGLDGRRF